MGRYVIVGAFGNDDAGSNSGSAYIFYRNEGGMNNWGEVTKIVASDAAMGDLFGVPVSIWEDYAIVGATGEDSFGSRSGAAYIFYRNEGGEDNWGQFKKIVAIDGKSLDRFGFGASIWGNYAVVGAPALNTAGSAYIIEPKETFINSILDIQKI